MLQGTKIDDDLTGILMWKVAGIRRRIALSKSCGLFVAPMIMTVHDGSVISPSHRDMNCAFIIAVASWSCVLRIRRNESLPERLFVSLSVIQVIVYRSRHAPISSMKIIQGWSFTASVKTAEANFWLSPYHLSVSMLTSKFINRVPASLAVAFAIRVLPHPGGPWSSTPFK